MEKEYLKLIEVAKEEMIKKSHAMSVANKIVKVSGKRYTLPLDGRDIDIVYYPAQSENAPLIIGCHGGGFVFGGCALDDAMWVATANYLDCNVASIGYRMSPDYKWEACLYDCFDASVYLKNNYAEFGFDPEHISIMGQSAGGNLAATVSLLAKEKGGIKFDNQILVYPFLDSYTEPMEKSGRFTAMDYVMNILHREENEAKNPLISPVFATEDMLKGLPNAIFAVSEYDFLRNEGEVYEKMLKSVGVNTSIMVAEKMPHAYFEFGFKGSFKPEDYEFLGENGKVIVESGLLRETSYKTLEFIKENFIK